MIKTKYSSIVSHKFDNQYICYDSSIQPILQERILSCFSSDEFRLNNKSIDFSHILSNLSDTKITNTFDVCSPIFSYINRRGIFYTGDIILSKIEGITLDKYISDNNMDSKFYSDLSFCFKTLFENGIFNIDMNLKNIIFNTKTQKISFIDFDKLIINLSKKGDKKMTSSVLTKFKKSLSKFNLDNKFDWEEFTK